MLLIDARDEILAVCDKHGVKLLVDIDHDDNNYSEIVVEYKTDEVIGSIRLYNE